jgi:hypothetical protein
MILLENFGFYNDQLSVVSFQCAAPNFNRGATEKK